MRSSILGLALLPVLVVIPACSHTSATQSITSTQPALAPKPTGAVSSTPAAGSGLAAIVTPPPATSSVTEVAEDFKPSTSNQPGKRYPMVNSQRIVRAQLNAPGATRVQLDIGAVKYDLRNNGSGVWTGDSAPQDEGFHYYQLVVDGAQVPDPGSTYFYGASRWGSGVEVPAKDDEFYALKNVPHGQICSVQFFSKTTKAVEHCFIYLPPDYDKDPSRKYPVLYLQHGGGENEYGWAEQGFTGRIMDNLIADGKAKPFIVVMATSNVGPSPFGPPRGPAPAAGGPAAGPNSGPATAPAGPRRMNFNFSAFEHLLLDDLVPFVEAHYRVMPDQPHRAMAGLSMGGMQTRTISLAHPDEFGYVGIFSGGAISPNDLGKNRDSWKANVKLIFLSFGGRERGAQAKAAAQALNEAGLKAVYYESPGTAHEWQSWRRSLHEIAPLLFQE